MKKYNLIMITVILLLAATIAQGGLFQFGAGKKPVEFNLITQPLIETGAAITSKCIFTGFVVKTDGTNNVTLTFHDNASAASGNLLLPTAVVVPGTARIYTFGYSPGVPAYNGVYVTISVAGGGATAVMVLYDQG